MKLCYSFLFFSMFNVFPLLASSATSPKKFDDNKLTSKLKWQITALKVITTIHSTTIERLKTQLAQEKKEHAQFKHHITTRDKAHVERCSRVIQESEARQKANRIEFEKREQERIKWQEECDQRQTEIDAINARIAAGRKDYEAAQAALQTAQNAE